MNWIENVLIIAGVSLDIFAAMECQGALVAKVDKKQLSVICALIAVWQLCALALGNYLSGLPPEPKSGASANSAIPAYQRNNCFPWKATGIL